MLFVLVLFEFWLMCLLCSQLFLMKCIIEDCVRCMLLMQFLCVYGEIIRNGMCVFGLQWLLICLLFMLIFGLVFGVLYMFGLLTWLVLVIVFFGVILLNEVVVGVVQWWLYQLLELLQVMMMVVFFQFGCCIRKFNIFIMYVCLFSGLELFGCVLLIVGIFRQFIDGQLFVDIVVKKLLRLYLWCIGVLVVFLLLV